MIKALLLWQVGLIANVKLHFCQIPTNFRHRLPRYIGPLDILRYRGGGV